jgi:uncharacterized protein YcnI
MIVRRIAVTLALVLACAGCVEAHVRVSPHVVPAHRIALLTFRCPNERTSTPTVKLEIRLPEDVPLALVTVPPVAGWRSRVTGQTITWYGGTIAPGTAGRFRIVVGPIPAGHPLIFRAVQTYGSGEIVRWIQVRAAGEAEPPFPAPVVLVH